MSKADPFPNLMRAFFYEWLVKQRNASVDTVRSYRETWRLFLRFVAQRAEKTVAMITLADLTASEVAAFLRHAGRTASATPRRPPRLGGSRRHSHPQLAWPREP
jgi:integrase/recombinase XerC